MNHKTIYLPKNLVVTIDIKYNIDNLVISFTWNKRYKELPFDKEKKDRMDGCTLEKTNLVMKLSKYLLLVNDNRKNVNRIVRKYLSMTDKELGSQLSVTPIKLYRQYLQDGLQALARSSDFHLGLIELLELLWI